MVADDLAAVVATTVGLGAIFVKGVVPATIGLAAAVCAYVLCVGMAGRTST